MKSKPATVKMKEKNAKETKSRTTNAASPLKSPHGQIIDPRVEALVREIIERVADKWTMLVLEVLEEHGTVRFTQVGEHVGGISQKMLTKTLRQMEYDGLVTRTIHPIIPPRVDYQLTALGRSLGEAFCGVWIWVEKHHDEITRARKAFTAANSHVR